MSDLSFSDLAAAAGQTTGNWLKDIGNTAADFACSLYHNHPSWVVNHFDVTGVSTGFGSGLMNSLCSPRPSNNTPPSPTQSSTPVCWRFSGMDAYKVHTFDLFVCGEVPTYTDRGTFGSQAVVAPTIDGNPASNDSNYLYAKDTATITQVADDTVGSGSNYKYGNCSACSGAVPTSSGNPTPQELTTNTTVNNVTTQVSFLYASADTGLHIAVGGVNIRFDHNGMTLNDNSLNINNSIGQLTTNLGSISSTVNTINKNTNSLVFAPSIGLTSTSQQPASQGSKTNNPDMRIVTLELTNIPSGTYSRIGVGGNEAYKAGWFEFTYKGYAYPGEPVRYKRNCYLVPLGSDGYSYKLYSGFMGQITEYKLPPQI